MPLDRSSYTKRSSSETATFQGVRVRSPAGQSSIRLATQLSGTAGNTPMLAKLSSSIKTSSSAASTG
ncbi:MAG: hypothetical protein RLZZ450_7442 [Pseudomonadota bacterium]|jgi:hypothetical protein